MTSRKRAIRPGPPGDLRTRAEARSRDASSPLHELRESPSSEDALRLIHELEVHQIELEMQNNELHQTQEELEASRTRYFDLYDLAPVGYLTMSAQGVILEANLTAATLLGVTRTALDGQQLSRFILTEDQDNYHIQCTQLGAKGTQHSWETRMKCADGSTFWAHLQAAVAQDGETLITLQNISERKQAEATIARVESRLRQLQKAESLERLAGAIAHHFNNKFQAVTGNLELAMSDPSPNAKTVGFMREALRAALQAAEMSTLMLTYLGQRADKLAPLDLSQAGRWTLPLLKTSLSVEVPLETDFPSPGPIVRAHADQIQQILMQLVINAGEAVGTGKGAVRIAVTTVAPADIPEAHRFPVDWEPTSLAYACLEVADTGRGIADKDLEKIFEPFFSGKAAGRGLGLAVVLGIARAHGGAVSVWSEPGRGSTFRVYLPLSAAEAASPWKQVPEFTAGGAVLLVDNEDRVRSVASALLRGLGFSVLEASGGSEAVEVLGGKPAGLRLVLCDLTMPGMNGWETLAALRRLAPGIPAILTSGYDKVQVMDGYHPELPQAFLHKPYLLRELTDAIRLALGSERGPG
ncbi:MAG: hybrid sensor histidine kinase/response regulator [Candidatus Geothermincolia bacterium]